MFAVTNHGETFLFPTREGAEEFASVRCYSDEVTQVYLPTFSRKFIVENSYEMHTHENLSDYKLNNEVADFIYGAPIGSKMTIQVTEENFGWNSDSHYAAEELVELLRKFGC